MNTMRFAVLIVRLLPGIACRQEGRWHQHIDEGNALKESGLPSRIGHPGEGDGADALISSFNARKLRDNRLQLIDRFRRRQQQHYPQISLVIHWGQAGGEAGPRGDFLKHNLASASTIHRSCWRNASQFFLQSWCAGKIT
jgi:hypothetical protein